MSTRLLTGSAEELIAANSQRKSLLIQNEDASIDMFVKRERSENTTVSATDHDHLISAGGLLGLNWGTDGETAIKARWTIIAASGTPRVSVIETEDIVR